MTWWQRLFRSHRPVEGDKLLAEFEDTLMLVIDPEQLTGNLISRLWELLNVEQTVVYLADESQSPAALSRVPHRATEEDFPTALAATGKTTQWFRANQSLLFFHENEEVTDYLRDEIAVFLEQDMNLACPLVSMDRLIGIVFLRLGPMELDDVSLAKLRVLMRQAALAFENALLFKDRLRQNERMFRAEQLAVMGQFAAGIAHELRNPLTAIRSTVQFLASDFADDSQQRDFADGILEEVDRLNAIVGNLLSLARPADHAPQEIDVTEEIERCLGFIEAKAKSQSIAVRTQFDQALPKVSFNPAELRQVLLNVIMNGLQAMPDGGELSVTASASGFNGDGVLVSIADQGAGIPAEMRRKVLEPFFTTKAGGTGLGLAICNSIVKRHNGEIWIDPAEEQGTIVRIALQVG